MKLNFIRGLIYGMITGVIIATLLIQWGLKR